MICPVELAHEVSSLRAGQVADHRGYGLLLNRFLREHYIAEFNGRFQMPPAQRGTAFVPCRRKDRDLVFSVQCQRAVNRDNTVSFQNHILQIKRVNWRGTLAGCHVTVHQHLDGTLSITHGPHRLERYTAHGVAIPSTRNPATQLGKRRRLLAKAQNRTFHLLQKGHFNLLRTRLRWQIRPRTVLLSVEKLTTDPKMSASRLRLRVMIGNPLTNSAFRFNGCIISRSAATGFANVQLHTIWYRYKLVSFSWMRRVLL